MQEQELQYTAHITSIPRNFLPKDFKITDWNSLEPYLKELLDLPINTKEE
jgi:oligoendopeptidase F